MNHYGVANADTSTKR